MLRVGQVLYGYCEGYFDGSYGNKRIEAIGYDWVVCRTFSGEPLFACTDNETSISDILEKYTTYDDESETY